MEDSTDERDRRTFRPGDRVLVANSAPGLTGNERAVYVALAFYDGKRCDPSDEWIARNGPVKHRGSIVKARNGLREKGWLSWDRREGQTNCYKLTYPVGTCPAVPDMSGRRSKRCPRLPDTNRKNRKGL